VKEAATEVEAEAKYKKVVQDLRDKIEEGKKQREAKKTPSLLLNHILESMTIDVFPKVTYQKEFKTKWSKKINAKIKKKWGEGYMFFEIKQDGLYGRKTENQENLEKLVSFKDGKVEDLEAPNDAGLAEALQHVPQEKEVRIYQDMLADAIKLNAKDDMKRYITALEELFQNRENLLLQTKKGEYPDWYPKNRDHMLHTMYSNPQSGQFDKVEIKARLDLIHNLNRAVYQRAKARGDDHLKHLFANIDLGFCLDGCSRSIHDYYIMQDKGLDTDATTKDAFIQATLGRLSNENNGKELREDVIRAEFKRLIGTRLIQEKDPIKEQDIDTAVETAKIAGYL